MSRIISDELSIVWRGNLSCVRGDSKEGLYRWFWYDVKNTYDEMLYVQDEALKSAKYMIHEIETEK